MGPRGVDCYGDEIPDGAGGPEGLEEFNSVHIRGGKGMEAINLVINNKPEGHHRQHVLWRESKDSHLSPGPRKERISGHRGPPWCRMMREAHLTTDSVLGLDAQ